MRKNSAFSWVLRIVSSICLTGVTSAAVPTTKTSSAALSSSGVMMRSSVSILLSLAICRMVLLVIPGRMDPVFAVISLLSFIMKMFSPGPSATWPS